MMSTRWTVTVCLQPNITSCYFCNAPVRRRSGRWAKQAAGPLMAARSAYLVTTRRRQRCVLGKPSKCCSAACALSPSSGAALSPLWKGLCPAVAVAATMCTLGRLHHQCHRAAGRACVGEAEPALWRGSPA